LLRNFTTLYKIIQRTSHSILHYEEKPTALHHPHHHHHQLVNHPVLVCGAVELW